MKPLIGKKHSWGVSCEEIGFNYIINGFAPCINGFRFKILGCTVPVISFFDIDDLKIAAIDSNEYDYLLLIGNLRTMAADLDKIRKSKKPVIAICDFDFWDDVERYMAAGAQVIVFKELIRYG